MATLNTSMFLPSKFKPSFYEDHPSLSFPRYIKSSPKTNYSVSPVMRLFGPAIFEASKLKVVFVGVDKEKYTPKLPRTYTLTHSDITSKLTLAISHTINNSQLEGWYNRLQRDEVVAEWRKVKGKMSLHVHCHISGGHFFLDLFANLRYYIFRKELPVVLKAFVHGDVNLFNQHPELEDASVWVYFHSNLPEFNKVECWGPLRDAVAPCTYNNKRTKTMVTNQPEGDGVEEYDKDETRLDEACKEPCVCCFPSTISIPWIHSLNLQQTQQNLSVESLEKRQG
ncbi:hypothetical protein RND81_13G043100 [Saponaria officinalis]|uniref:Staygreen protein domain-containing protein n=1 Tax=Saponaria officinalis TaxID=3572 RepID=A0AAW1H0E1_SAPOF